METNMVKSRPSQTHNGLFVFPLVSLCLSVSGWVMFIFPLLFFPPLLLALLTRLTMHSPNFQSSCSPVIFCQSHWSLTCSLHLWLSMGVQSRSGALDQPSNGRWLKCSWSMYPTVVFIASIDHGGGDALNFFSLSLCTVPLAQFLSCICFFMFSYPLPLFLHCSCFNNLSPSASTCRVSFFAIRYHSLNVSAVWFNCVSGSNTCRRPQLRAEIAFRNWPRSHSTAIQELLLYMYTQT